MDRVIRVCVNLVDGFGRSVKRTKDNMTLQMENLRSLVEVTVEDAVVVVRKKPK